MTTKKERWRTPFVLVLLFLVLKTPEAFHLKHGSFAKTRHGAHREEPKKPIVRKALPADLSASASLLTRGFFPNANPISFFLERLKLEFRLRVLGSIFPDDERAVLVVCDDKVVGTVEIDNRFPFFSPVHPYMCNLTIDKDRRNQGLAQELIAAVEAYAMKEWDAQEMFLRVDESNTVAFSLYKKLGYTIMSKEAEVLTMTKELKSPQS